MNKEEFAIEEKNYENPKGLKIKIIFSNLGRRYKKIGENLYLMIEKETVKLEDSLTAMVRKPGKRIYTQFGRKSKTFA